MAKKERKARAPAAPVGETKADKFRRLGSARVVKAVKAISVIGNLAGSGYEYTPEQVQTIRDVLAGELETALGNFNRAGKAKREFAINL